MILSPVFRVVALGIFIEEVVLIFFLKKLAWVSLPAFLR